MMMGAHAQFVFNSRGRSLRLVKTWALQYMMAHPKLAAFSHYRPRVLTLVVLAAIVSAIWLANSIEDYRLRKYRTTAYPPPPSELQFNVEEASEADFRGISDQNLSYGWPLFWRQYVVELTMGTGPFIIAQNYSPTRLAVNLAIWLVLLAAPAGACEWLLRRYRPGWRFSLRTLFVATVLAAAFCAWFAVVRNRAAVQDPLIASVKYSGVKGYGVTVWGERWGPKWFDQIGADRYCRRILGMHVDARSSDERFVNDEARLRLLSDLHRLPDLQYHSLAVDELTPEIIGALGKAQRLETLELEIGELTPAEGEALAETLGAMQRLRALSVSGWVLLNDEMPDPCLAAIGGLGRLERLCLRNSSVISDRLALLAGLGNLKSLTLDDVFDLPESATLLASLPPLPQLEALDLRDTEVADRDLRYITRRFRLKSLNLSGISITGAALADLTPLETLEELTIDVSSVDSAGLSALAGLKRLKKLHIDLFGEEDWQSADALSDQFDLSLEEAEARLRAFAALRKTNPRLVIDGVDYETISLFEDLSAPKGESIPAYSQAEFHSRLVQAWKDKQAGKAKLQRAVNSTPAI